MRRSYRTHRLRNALKPRVFGSIGVAFALAGYLAAPSGSSRHAALVWNASASAPIGLYVVAHRRKPARGDLVLVDPPPPLAAFAANRGYLPQGVPLVKRIAAVAGDMVCARGNRLFISGHFASARLVADSNGRSLPAWTGCRPLREREVFLLMANVRTSFDGRYFGPTDVSQIAGTLRPIWTR